MSTSNQPAQVPHPAPGPATNPRRSGFRRLFWAVPVLALAGIVYRAAFAPVDVHWATVGRGDVASEAFGTGTLEARVAATISPKIQGRLTEVLVDQGDLVAQGQLLARLDDGEWREQVAMAEAGLQAALATVNRIRADEARARAVLGQARLSHDRAAELRRANVAAQADLDEAVEALRVAEADLTRSEAASIEAQRQQTLAERTFRFHQARLGDTRLTSPLDGLVVRRDRDPGDVAVPGNSILGLVATNEMWVSAWVDETAMRELHPGQRARVAFRSEPTNAHPGVVVRLGREADRETREFIVDVRVDSLPGNWAIGQRADVHIATASRAGVLRVPRAALRQRSGQPGVLVAVDGRARWTPVKPGVLGIEHAEIIEGIAEGDRIILGTVLPSKPVAHGTRVRLP